MAVPLSTSRLRTTPPARRVSPTGAVLRTPTLVRASQPRADLVPRRKLATPRVALKSPATTARKPEDKGLIGGALSSIGNIISFPGTVIKSLPTLIGKAGQSVVGLGETVFDIGADIISPGSYTSRSEVDLAKGRELGLKGPELLAYSMQRTVPFFAPIVESVPKTAARLGETATLGFVDTGAPGFDYYQALRRGELGTMALEDLGNIVLAGRALGVGNLGVQAGRRITAAGRPRLGGTISTIGRFAEEPIATTTRGVARAGLRIPKTSVGPLPREGVLASIATSEQPFRTITSEAGRKFRGLAEERVNRLDAQRGTALREKALAEREGRLADAERFDRQAALADEKRNFWVRLGENQYQQRQAVRTEQARTEAIKNTFNQLALRWDQRGSVPENPTQLRTRAENLRAQAVNEPDVARQAALTRQADLLDRSATVKETNPEKLNDQENRRVNFSAAVIVVSKLIDQIMRDRRAGKTVDEIMATIQPRELLPEVARQGYEYTPAAVQRAIDFVEGRLDDVDTLDMDVASTIMSSFADYLEGLVIQPGTLVGGVLPPSQFGDTPVPELVLAELNNKSYENVVLEVLDELVPAVITNYFPELVEGLADSFDNPGGLFKKLAESRPDSPEYAASRAVLMFAADAMSDPQTSIFANKPRQALQVAEFFRNPAIYPARLRPMVAYGVSRAQEAGAQDVTTTLAGLSQMAADFPDLFSEGRLKRLAKLQEEMADPRRKFDRDFYKGVQDFLNGVLNDIQRRRSATTARQGVVEGRVAASDARLAEIEAQARAAAGMVEQALLRPEELTPTTIQPTPDATIQRSLDNVETGKPFEGTLYRGTGGINVEGTGADALFGPGVYATPDLQYAETFASDFTDPARPQIVGNIDQVSVRLQNPLVIRTAEQWRALTAEAGWEFPKIRRGAEAMPLLASLRQLIESQGYDGVIVKFDPNMPVNSALADMTGGEQVVAFSPQAVMPAEQRARLAGVTQESQALRQQADELRAEAGRLSSQPSQVAGVASRIEADTTTRETVQQALETETQELRDLEAKLAVEERLLNSVASDAQEPDLLLAEVVAAEELARQGVGAEPLPSEQKAWKAEQVRARQADVDLAQSAVNAMFPGGDPPKLSREDFWVEDIWVNLKKAIPNPRHFREFFARLTETKYEGVKGRIPTRAEFAPADPNVGKLEGMGKVRLDEAASDNPRGPIATEEWTLQLAEAWSRYMQAVDALNEMKRKPLKSDKAETVKDAMMRERSGDLQQQAWENPRTGETMYGVRPLSELRRIEQMVADTEAFAKQYELVQELRREVGFKSRAVQESTRRLREIDSRIQRITEEATQGQLRGPQAEAQRLLGEARRLTSEADRLDAENVRLRPTVAKERITLTRQSGKRLRAANARRAEGREVTGYEFTKGVAKKLDDAQTEQLREQQRLYEENRLLQARLNEQDAALGEGATIREEAGQYVGALGEPTPRALLGAAADRPRLLGETDQPTWIPVGESSGVRPASAMDVTMRGEGIAPESRISIERRRQSTYMAQTPAQFAARMKEILGQVARNRVVARIIGDELLTTDVQTIIPEPRRVQLEEQATRMVTDQGYNRGTREFDTAYKKTYGDLVIDELNIMGYEAVSPVQIPEEGDIYAGRAALGTLSEITTGDNISPTTLVMRRGMRESLSSYFEPKGGSRIPPKLAAVFNMVGRNTSKWKSVVLPFSLRWQVGDAMGNVINAYIRADINPIDLAGRIQDVYRRLQEPDNLTFRQTMTGDVMGSNVADPVIQVLLGAGLQAYGIRLSDLKAMHPTGTLKPSPGVLQGGGFRPFFPRFREKSFAFNETQNGIVRSAVAIAKLEEALMARGRNLNEIDPVTVHNDPVLYEAVREAVDQANDALGNFSELSPYEKQFVRTVYPFWSWVKFINKAAAQLLIDQPDSVLFYGHLGSMATGDDANDLYDWLKNQTPINIPGIGNVLIDLSFTNPYSDAILLGRNPFEESVETFTNVSPVLRAGLRTGGEIAYGVSGRRFPLLETVSRPGYLEGRPGTTTRSLGDVLGGIAYQNFRTFAGPYRFLTDVAPTVRVPGTDVTLGPGPRYGQGSVRASGVYSRPLLSPTQERIGAVLQGLGIPVPSAQVPEARAQGREIRRTGLQSLRRRERERRLSRIRQ